MMNGSIYKVVLVLFFVGLIFSACKENKSSDGDTDSTDTSSDSATEMPPAPEGACSGVRCAEPPANECADSTTLRIFNPIGWCGGGACEYATREEACEIGLCAEGICVETPCQGVTCGTPPVSVCDGDDLRVYSTVGFCTAVDGVPACEYASQVVACDDGCANGQCVGNPCAGVRCDAPPSGYCDQELAVLYQPQGRCEGGECIYSEIVYPCEAGCGQGRCLGADPCEGVVCNVQPASYCSSGDALRAFSATGRCSNGACLYEGMDIPCDEGCADGQCVNEPCAGVHCADAPAAYCDDNLLMFWDGVSGACSDGVCAYNIISTQCTEGCAAGRCSGEPCTGVNCTAGPSDYCDGSDLLLYADFGQCTGNGLCAYTSIRTTCPFGCAGAACMSQTCAALNCGTNGVCDESGAAAVCDCDPGWAGLRCDRCAPGWHDEAGSCLLDYQCLQTTCAGHGTCDDANGVITCSCDTGYTDTFCEDCAADYHVEGGACLPDEYCAQSDPCNPHFSTCNDTGGMITCVCETGFSGDTCDICTDDNLENNDTGSLARIVGDGYSTSSLIICPEDDDYFVIDLQAGDSLSVLVAWPPAGGDADLLMLYPNADPMVLTNVVEQAATSEPGMRSLFYTVPAGQSGRYYLALLNDAADVRNTYSIDIVVDEGCADGCFIDSVCYPNGAVRPGSPCEFCIRGVSAEYWTVLNGVPCDDGVFCNGTEWCVEGECGESSGNPCAGPDQDTDCFESCHEDSDNCLGFDGNGAACDLDGIGCTADVCTGAACAAGEICPVYVDVASMDTDPDGSSWSRAFRTVQEGVDAAAMSGNPRVFVAMGMYSENLNVFDTDSGQQPPQPGANALVTMADGVAIYGGFAGVDTEYTPEDRPSPMDYSVLDALSSGRVVIGASNALLDGFVVSRGQNTLNGQGAGMYNYNVVNTDIRNVRFQENLIMSDELAVASGGAMYSVGSSLRLTSVMFTGNEVYGNNLSAGGAMFSVNTSLVLNEVLFVQNRVNGSANLRGGAMASTDCTVEVNDSFFFENEASGSMNSPVGAAVYNSGTAFTARRTVFHNNRIPYGANDGTGAAIYHDGQDDGVLELDQCVFIGNQIEDTYSGAEGGAVAVRSAPVDIAGTRFTGNSARAGFGARGGAVSMSDCPGATIDSCRFEGNSLNSGHSNGGALDVSANWDTDTGNDDPVAVTNSMFMDNSADGSTDAYGAAVQGSGPNLLQLAHNNFYNNWISSPISSGAVHSNDQLEINNSTFYGNTYSDVSGAAALDDEANCYAAWMVDTDLIVPVDTEGTGNIWNTVNPFISAGLGTNEIFLDQSSVCVDAGRNAVADELWPGGWSVMTTDVDWTPEGSTLVDTGVHYDPSRLHIRIFELEGSAYWELLVPDSTWSCFIYYVSLEDGLRSVEIPADQLSSGYMDGDFYDGAWLTCRSTAGDMVTTYGFTGDLSGGGGFGND